MPELPEVETVRRGLSQLFKDHPKILGIEARRPDLRFPIPKELLKSCKVPMRARSVSRRAKYLLIETDHGVLLSHLGMTGSWRYQASKKDLRTHDHLLIKLEKGYLIYHDPRRFGFVDWLQTEKPESSRWLRHLGAEPLSDEWTGEDLFRTTRRRQTSIKVLLMNQAIVVGVGNIYVAEALFRAGVRPTRQAAKIKREECFKIVAAVKEVLQAAIQVGGTTIRDFRQADGEVGYFHQQLQVYGRAGEPCIICRGSIQSRNIGQRSSFWCPNCQS